MWRGDPGLAYELAEQVTLVALVAAVSLVLRWRRAVGDERQQLKVFVWVTALAIAVFFGRAFARVAPITNTLALPAIPVATGIAVLKYRLYDIDHIINRTVSYALLTALLVAVYLGLVFALQQLLRPITHEAQLAVAGATLVVAAVFGPLRRRVQVAVDRRFNRARYDAQRTVDDFRARMRDGVDLGQLGSDLVGAVRSTVEPADVSRGCVPGSINEPARRHAVGMVAPSLRNGGVTALALPLLNLGTRPREAR